MKNKSMIAFTILVLLSGCITNPSKPAADWQLAFHHDATGNRIDGSKQMLIDAVNTGRPIRVVWPMRDDFIHVADAGFLTVMKGEVFAQFNGIIRQIPDRKTRRSIALDAEDQNNWHAIISTTGQLQGFQSKGKGLSSSQWAFKWYTYK